MAFRGDAPFSLLQGEAGLPGQSGVAGPRGEKGSQGERGREGRHARSVGYCVPDNRAPQRASCPSRSRTASGVCHPDAAQHLCARSNICFPRTASPVSAEERSVSRASSLSACFPVSVVLRNPGRFAPVLLHCLELLKKINK